MNFLDFYNQHYISLTFIIVILIGIITSLIIYFFRKSNKKVKTPWFEIAPDSVNTPESEDMGKTRLLLKRQFEYVDNYINGLSNTFLALEKAIVDDANLKMLDRMSSALYFDLIEGYNDYHKKEALKEIINS